MCDNSNESYRVITVFGAVTLSCHVPCVKHLKRAVFSSLCFFTISRVIFTRNKRSVQISHNGRISLSGRGEGLLVGKPPLFREAKILK